MTISTNPPIERPGTSQVEDVPIVLAIGYEKTDISVSRVLLFMGVVVVGLILIQLVIWEVLRTLNADAAPRDLSSSWNTTAADLPPLPRLQEQPLREYREFLQGQMQRLDSYGWIDRQQRKAHIPIARAMELSLEQGTPGAADSKPM